MDPEFHKFRASSRKIWSPVAYTPYDILARWNPQLVRPKHLQTLQPVALLQLLLKEAWHLRMGSRATPNPKPKP